MKCSCAGRVSGCFARAGAREHIPVHIESFDESADESESLHDSVESAAGSAQWCSAVRSAVVYEIAQCVAVLRTPVRSALRYETDASVVKKFVQE